MDGGGVSSTGCSVVIVGCSEDCSTLGIICGGSVVMVIGAVVVSYGIGTLVVIVLDIIGIEVVVDLDTIDIGIDMGIYT